MGVVGLSGAGGRKNLYLKMGCSSGATRGLWLTLISVPGSALRSSAVNSRKRESTGDVWVERECVGVVVEVSMDRKCGGVGVEVWTDRNSLRGFIGVWVAADVRISQEWFELRTRPLSRDEAALTKEAGVGRGVPGPSTPRGSS